jgi:3alpha(or 20beta)-hydroxysteroid dehydrogenase
MARFDGKVVLISGSARGQGAAEARLLVAEGAKVVLGDVLEAEGEALARELGPAAVFLRQDVTRPEDWARCVAAAEALGGGLHGLVNNAGIYVPKPLMETDAELFERHMRVNQLGCFLGMKAVVPAMERAGGGSIVNISSTAGLRGSPGAIAYSSTKWALRGMTKAAAIDLAPRGIRVNSVHPGPIDTDMVKVWSNEQRATRIGQIPMGRMGTAEEVARTVLFLLSDDSAYMTGAELAIDDGPAVVRLRSAAAAGRRSPRQAARPSRPGWSRGPRRCRSGSSKPRAP